MNMILDKLKIVIYRENALYVAACPALDFNASAYILEEAVTNLTEVIHASLDMFNEEGLLEKYLKKKGWTKNVTWQAPPIYNIK